MYKYNDYRKAWRKANPEKVAAQNARARTTQRNWRFRREYKLNVEMYEKMFEQQNGKCAICERDWTNFKHEFAIDHCHKTGKVRGLLCFPCNTKLATVENSLFMLKAQDYLRKVHSNSF